MAGFHVERLMAAAMAILVMAAVPARAAMIAHFDFDSPVYSAGSLNGQGIAAETADNMTDPTCSDIWYGTTGASAVQVVPNPASLQYLPGDQVVRLGNGLTGSNGRDLVNNTGGQNGFGSFMLNVAAVPAAAKRFMVHVRTDDGDARLSIGLRPDGAGFNIGADPHRDFNSGLLTFAPTTLAVDTWSVVLFEWKKGTPANNEQLRLWVNPGPGDQGAPDIELTGLASLVLVNQLENLVLINDPAYTLYIDNVIYGTTFGDVFQAAFQVPEPGSLALLFAAALVCLRGRHRRRRVAR